MAYMQFDDLSASAPVAPLPTIARQVEARFSALEWSVIALARNDGLWTLRQPGRVSQTMGALFGHGPNPRLADERLEALRRTAVLAWHGSEPLDTDEIESFVEAGFERAQLDLLVASVTAGRMH